MSVRQHIGALKTLRRYWKIFGGWSALIRSPYFLVSSVLWLVTALYWINKDWWTQPLQILPNVLGFTLAGFAVFLAFGDKSFQELIAGEDVEESDEHSPFMGFSATFLHFVIVQILALSWAVVTSALRSVYVPWPNAFEDFVFILNLIGSAIGYWLFLYSISTALAAAVAIFRTADIFDEFVTRTRHKSKIDHRPAEKELN